MAELQPEVSYWISVAIRTTQTFPAFIGNNWVGVFLSCALLLPGIRTRVRSHVTAIAPLAWPGKFIYTGRALMKTNWQTVGMIVLVFWIGNFLTVGFRDYANASEQTRKTSGQLIEARAKVASGAVDCQLQTNGISSELGAQKAQNSTLQKQNRDQQASINGCLSKAIDLIPKPEPFKETILLLDNPKQDNPAMKGARWLILSNKTVTPIIMFIQCDLSVASMEVEVVGGAPRGGGTDRISTNSFRAQISTPAWSPVSPLLVTGQFFDQNTRCSFIPQ